MESISSSRWMDSSASCCSSCSTASSVEVICERKDSRSRRTDSRSRVACSNSTEGIIFSMNSSESLRKSFISRARSSSISSAWDCIRE